MSVPSAQPARTFALVPNSSGSTDLLVTDRDFPHARPRVVIGFLDDQERQALLQVLSAPAAPDPTPPS